MSRTIPCTCLVICLSRCGTARLTAAEPLDEAQAAAKLELFGVRLTRDEKLPERPVVALDLGPSHHFSARYLHLLAPLRRLRRLDLKEIAVTDSGLDQLQGLADLEDLNLSWTRITDTGLMQLRRFQHLRTLKLASTEIGDAGLLALVSLDRLETLDLSGTKVTDAGLQYLGELTSLRHVYLWRSKVTPEGVKSLKRILPATELRLVVKFEGFEYPERPIVPIPAARPVPQLVVPQVNVRPGKP